MRRRAGLGLVAFAAALAAGSFVLTASGRRSADAQCNQNIQENFVLTSDLDCSGTNGLVIAAPGITVDLNGHTVSGDGVIGAGVYFTFAPGAKVINGTVEDFPTGVLVLTTAPKATVSGLRVTGSTADGLLAATGATGLTVRDSSFAGNDTGIALDGATGTKLDRVHVSASVHHGIWVSNSPGTKVTGVTSTRNGLTGLVAQGASSGLSVAKSAFSANDTTGLQTLDASSGASIKDVTAAGNSGDGIEIFSTDATLQKVTAAGNTGHGIRLSNAVGASISSVTLSGNGGPGLSASAGSTGVSISKASASGNEGDGFFLNDTGAVVKGSTAAGNGDWGFEAAGAASDGGGNVARANVQPDGCTPVGFDC